MGFYSWWAFTPGLHTISMTWACRTEFHLMCWAHRSWPNATFMWWARGCHNPIFTPRIFLGVGTQNETAQTKPAWFDKGSPHQITPRRRSGTYFPKFYQVWLGLTRFDQAVSDPTGAHYARKPSKCGPGYISQSSEKFDQVWLGLTRFDQGWPRFDRGLTEPFPTRLGSTTPRNPQNVVRDKFPRVWRALTKFDQVWPRLTKVWPDRWPDRKLNRTDHSLTILKSVMRDSIRRFTG